MTEGNVVRIEADMGFKGRPEDGSAQRKRRHQRLNIASDRTSKSSDNSTCTPVGPVSWVACRDGRVPPGAIVAGKEKNNPYTFIGRIYIRGERCLGRVVPSTGGCYAIRRAMEHRRRTYEVLVNASNCGLVWRRDNCGHVPDTAIQLGTTSVIGKTSREPTFYGRTSVTKGVVVPGYVLPSHGVIHVGHDNKESVKEEYEVLCRDEPCSLRYLAAKKIRDRVREHDKHYNAKCSTKIANIIYALEKIFANMCKKEPRKRDTSEEKLELPKILVNYLQSPKLPNVAVMPRLDFNTIMTNCCPPEENCSCQMWVEVTLQGLY